MTVTSRPKSESGSRSFAASDAGISYYGLCKDLGRTPSEIGALPVRDRTFLKLAYAEHTHRRQDALDDV